MSTSRAYTLVRDLAAEVRIPEHGILSRPLLDNESTKVVLFSFSRGQELSEHTAAVPAILHFLSGQADVVLGGDHLELGAGAWVHMAPGVSHAIRARSDMSMLLVLLKRAVVPVLGANLSKQ
jgi:quercetin dioxygenase-like cupin family protein